MIHEVGFKILEKYGIARVEVGVRDIELVPDTTEVTTFPLIDGSLVIDVDDATKIYRKFGPTQSGYDGSQNSRLDS